MSTSTNTNPVRMSSGSHATRDALVTVKVMYDGFTRRVKMPLHELVPVILEQNVRALLQIPNDATVMIERYSDSAAAFVMLDTANTSVYKQLHRAAKAKSKLKLRVSLLHRSESVAPQPAAVKDVPEPVDAISSKKPEPADTCPFLALPVTSPCSLSPEPMSGPDLVDLINSSTKAGLLPLFKEMPSKTTAQNPENSGGRNLEQTKLESLESQMAKCRPFAFTATMPTSVPQCTPTQPTEGPMFAVRCNHCEKTMPDAHYHCATCDDGDFDLCQSCVDLGATCFGDDHWLIKRRMNNGQIVNSTTETLVSKAKSKPSSPIYLKPDPMPATADQESYTSPVSVPALPATPAELAKHIDPESRTQALFCCSCMFDISDTESLACLDCDDYHVCQQCFMNLEGHHPAHMFTPFALGSEKPSIRAIRIPRCSVVHHAICDGCDKSIIGVRHKCIDCPDWDYCDHCVRAADLHHPKHRFVPVYEPIAHPGATVASQQVHTGICCDGPLCTSPRATNSYIRGVRYKCAVCHDLDFCANCEASPSNEHNKSHPLIKLKMPVRNLSVSSFAESHDGTRMRTTFNRSSTASKAAERVLSRHQNSMNAVQTVMDVKPVEATAPPLHTVKAPVTEPKPELQCKEEDLRAVFLRDSVADGTIFPPNHVFEQTWILRNEGKGTWPAGCCVKFVGGDYMGHVDPSHPAGIGELVSASESTVCYAPLGPGQEFSFISLLRTPSRPGKMISYWRLTAPDGTRFGHRLWCEVNVRAPAPKFTPAPDHSPELKSNETSAVSSSVESSTDDSAVGQGSVQSSSVLLFPRFDQECLNIGMTTHNETETVNDAGPMDSEHVEEDDEWDDDEDFLTDDEYDILDASDDEFLQEQQETLSKK